MPNKKFQGLIIRIENPVGSIRKGKDRVTGKPWATEMSCDYGEILDTKGMDGQPVDVFLGKYPGAKFAFVIHQLNPNTGEFDEDKVCLGFLDAQQAKDCYFRHYDNPKKFYGALSAVSMAEFKQRLVKTPGRQIAAMSKIQFVLALQACGCTANVGDQVTVDGLRGRGNVVSRTGKRLTIKYPDGTTLSRDDRYVHPMTENDYKNQYSSLRAGEEMVERENGPVDNARPGNMYIVKSGSLFCVRSRNQMDKDFGCYNSREEAENAMNGRAFNGLKAYGTSEGVTKAWDTRGRGRNHPDRDVHIYGEKAPKERAVVQKIFDSLPETHKNLLRDQNLLVYVVNKSIPTSPEGHLRGGYTEQSTDLPLKMKLPTSVSLGNNDAKLSSGMFKEIATHEFGHAYALAGGMDGDDWKKYASIYKPKSTLSDRAKAGLEEHFAEAYGTYLRNPARLERIEPDVYSFMKERFGGSDTKGPAEDKALDAANGQTGWQYGRNIARGTGYIPSRSLGGFPTAPRGVKKISLKVPKMAHPGHGAHGPQFGRRPATVHIKRTTPYPNKVPNAKVTNPKPARSANPSSSTGSGFGVKRTLESEGVTGSMGNAHIDPVVWFHPPSLTKRQPNEATRVPTDDVREDNDKFLDVTKRNSPDTKEQRMKILKRSGTGAISSVPARTTLLQHQTGANFTSGMTGMYAGKSRRTNGRARQFTSFARRGAI